MAEKKMWFVGIRIPEDPKFYIYHKHKTLLGAMGEVMYLYLKECHGRKRMHISIMQHYITEHPLLII